MSSEPDLGVGWLALSFGVMNPEHQTDSDRDSGESTLLKAFNGLNYQDLSIRIIIIKYFKRDSLQDFSILLPKS
jgi:hypothetical protein